MNLTFDDSPEAIERIVQQLVKELSVDRKNTSSYRRRLISAKDDRPSAQGIGYIGVIILVSVIGSIVVMDLGTLKQDFIRMLGNVRKIWIGKSSVKQHAVVDTTAASVTHVDLVLPSVHNQCDQIEMPDSSMNSDHVNMHLENTFQNNCSLGRETAAILTQND